MNYYLWTREEDDRSLAWIMSTPAFLMDHPKEYQLYEGVSVRSWWLREPVVYNLSDERGIRLSDAIPCVGHDIIVSEELKRLLEERSGADIEFLSVRILNQKQRLVPEPYFLMNLLGTVDCVDLERSKFKRSAIRPDLISTFYLLVLDESRIPADKKLFRLKHSPKLVVIREDLGREILDAGCDGMFFLDLEEYGKEWGRR
ncbi:imm11 family protein [Archangium sp.]|uniref:imm11 family protein n=1 Tax=Archangium sp. TaxID=1872627 RepID=UPI002D760A48|nr:DUF1629 domain-containing protein [Archangium sp.]HYO56131.1 DUF1629 domain-containing protein [Archangium sp.]